MVVTTVIPTIGRETLWTRAVPSVEVQQAEWRIIVVGDGVDIPPFPDPRITVLRIPRQKYPADPHEAWLVSGTDAARHGVEHVETEWWSYLSDDDAYDPQHHELLLDGAEDFDLVFGRSMYHVADVVTPVRSDPPVPPGDMDVCQGAYIIRTSLHHYPSAVRVREGGWDATWWRQLRERGDVRFKRVPAVVLHYYPERTGWGFQWAT